MALRAVASAADRQSVLDTVEDASEMKDWGRFCYTASVLQRGSCATIKCVQQSTVGARSLRSCLQDSSNRYHSKLLRAWLHLHFCCDGSSMHFDGLLSQNWIASSAVLPHACGMLVISPCSQYAVCPVICNFNIRRISLRSRLLSLTAP
jgi:hypothetical protein